MKTWFHENHFNFNEKRFLAIKNYVKPSSQAKYYIQNQVASIILPDIYVHMISFQVNNNIYYYSISNEKLPRLLILFRNPSL